VPCSKRCNLHNENGFESFYRLAIQINNQNRDFMHEKMQFRTTHLTLGNDGDRRGWRAARKNVVNVETVFEFMVDRFRVEHGDRFVAD
jgi:hypothetical protein